MRSYDESGELDPLEARREVRRAEELAWENRVRELARDYISHLAEHPRPPVYVFFGNVRERERLRRDLMEKLAPLDLPVLPRVQDFLRPTPEALRGHSRHLVMVHQSYPWLPQGRDAHDADEAVYLIDILNRANGWTT